MPLFNGAELRDFIEQADYVTVNDYESNLLQERTGWDEKTIAGKVKAYIATRGPKGAVIFADGQTIDVPPAHERRITDPTGRGHAFRAGDRESVASGKSVSVRVALGGRRIHK